MRISETAKVGVVALLAALLLMYATFSLRGSFARGITYNQPVTFDDAQGIQPGAPVRIRGVNVGEVGDVRLTTDRKAELVLRMRFDVPIGPKDSVTINGSLLGFGQPYVEITPNGRKQRINMTRGESIPGDSGTSTTTIVSKTEDLVDNLNGLVGKLNRLSEGLAKTAEDPKLRGSLTRTVDNFEKVSASGVKIAKNMEGATGKASHLIDSFQSTSRQLDTTLKRADRLLAGFSTTADETKGLMKDARGLVADTRETVKGAKDLVQNTNETVTKTGKTVEEAGGLVKDTRAVIADNREKLGQVLDGVNSSLKKLDSTLDEAKSLIADPEARANLKATAANIKDATENLKGISADVRGITGDPKVQQELRETLSNLRDATSQAAEVFRKVGGVVGSSGKTAKSVAQRFKETELRAEGGHTLRTDRTHLDFDATIPWSDSTFYRVGLYDFGEANKFNAQAGQRLRNGVWSRYGVHASTLGLGLDFGDRTRPWLQSDLFGVDRPRLDVHGYVPIWKGLDLSLGVDSVFRRADPVVGIRYRR